MQSTEVSELAPADANIQSGMTTTVLVSLLRDLTPFLLPPTAAEFANQA